MGKTKTVLIVLSTLSILGCGELVVDVTPDGADIPPDGTTDFRVDLDGDGYPSDLDCDDQDPQIHPRAEEVCDDVDNDCDGFVDNTREYAPGRLTVYIDADNDGHGDSMAEPFFLCSRGRVTGLSRNNDDCNDRNADVFRGQDEHFSEPYFEGCDDPEGCYDYNCDGGVSISLPISDGCQLQHGTCLPAVGFMNVEEIECGSLAEYNEGCHRYHGHECIPREAMRMVECR